VVAARERSLHPPAPPAPVPARPDLAQQLAAFQAALPGSRGAAYLQQRGIPLTLAQQLGVGYAAPGTWLHAARDWRGGRVVFPHTTPDGRLVNLYGRAVGTAEQVPKATRHDHLPGAKGYFNATALRGGAGPLWVCEGAFDALALLAAGVSRIIAIFGVHSWRWDWVREVRELVFAFDADAAGQQQWRQLARQAALRGKHVSVLEPVAYGGQKDVSAAWAAGVLRVEARLVAAHHAPAPLEMPDERREVWAERVAIMVTDGGVRREDAKRLAWAALQAASDAS
jgi:Toprim-like